MSNCFGPRVVPNWSILDDASYSSMKIVFVLYGAYRVEVTVDPNNLLGEDPALREDNTTIWRFILKKQGDRFE